MASELIKKLQDIVSSEGDMPVTINSVSQISTYSEPYYYDGGYSVPVSLSKEKSPYYKPHQISSSNTLISKKYPWHIRLQPLGPSNPYDSVDGVPLIESDPDWKKVPIKKDHYYRIILKAIPYYKEPYKSKYTNILLNSEPPEYPLNKKETNILLKQIKEKSYPFMICNIQFYKTTTISTYLDYLVDNNIPMPENYKDLVLKWKLFKKNYKNYVKMKIKTK